MTKRNRPRKLSGPKREKQREKALRLINQKRYVRFGECNQCGDCCETEDCEYFKRINKDRGICLAFGKVERPAKCGLFPEVPQHPYERCSYWFEDRHNNNEKIYPKQWPGPQGGLDDSSSK